jgi:hypothetical protein
LTSLRYAITFAHADTRETGGELTDDTPKGWGNIEIEVDHLIETDEDRLEVARAISRAGLEDGDEPRYTHVAINTLRLLGEPGELEPSDFITLANGDVEIPGVSLGDDHFYAFWGWDISDEDAGAALERYFESVLELDDGLRLELQQEINRRKPQRVIAWQIGTREDLALAWGRGVEDAPEGEATYPLTIIDIS